MAMYELVKTDWGSIFPKAKQYAIEHSPQILTGVGLSAMIAAGVIAVRNTPAACRTLEERRADEGVDKLPLVDVVKFGFKYYVVPVGMALAGSTCIISGLRVCSSRADAFAALAASQAVHIKDIHDVTREKIGEKKTHEIDTEVARRGIERDGVPPINQIEETGHGDQIVYWPMLGRWFRCDIGWIRRVQNEINREITEGDVNENDPYDTKTLNGVCLNRFLAGLNLKKCDLGMVLGWNGANRVNIRFFDIVTGQESEKAVILEMNMDDCMPREKWDSIRQTHPQRIAPF